MWGCKEGIASVWQGYCNAVFFRLIPFFTFRDLLFPVVFGGLGEFTPPEIRLLGNYLSVDLGLEGVPGGRGDEGLSHGGRDSVTAKVIRILVLLAEEVLESDFRRLKKTRLGKPIL